MRNYLKIMIAFVASAIFLWGVAFAEVNSFILDELGIEVSIPSDYTVITRDTPDDDAVFRVLGVSKSDIVSYYESSSIYLNAFSVSYNEEIVVTMTDGVLESFTPLNDTLLISLASMLVEQFDEYGIEVIKYDIYNHPRAKFIRIYCSDPANSVYGLQYYTMNDGKAINFTMRSYEGSISSRQEETIKLVVDSIVFIKAPHATEVVQTSGSFIYTDSNTGITFTVPANWEQDDFTKERQYLDAKFVTKIDGGCAILFSQTDLWEEMSVLEKLQYPRSSLNNSAFTKSDIAEMYGTTPDKISLVSYNGIQYFMGERTQSSNVYGLDVSVTMTVLTHIENGNVIMFQFSGTKDHNQYADFVSMLNTVQIPSRN